MQDPLFNKTLGKPLKTMGMSIWDIKSRKSEFFNIHNDYGYYTLRVNDGVLPNIDNIPKYPRLRFITENTPVN